MYNLGNERSRDIYNLAAYIDEFAKVLGITSLQTNLTALHQVVTALTSPDFPHVDGMEKASPFKKAAYFFVWFIAAKPVIDPLPGSVIPSELRNIANHQNVIFAYHIAADALHKAVLHKNETEVSLNHHIRVSKHFFIDFVDAFSAAVPAQHFKIASLLFEQLCYKANPGLSYPETV
ncbi:MAG: hypothetical protein LBK60_07995 [Verrucomicrobiales bacterium]|nr:hypothetical protein [Verrucomicrobiales bacterium]